MSVAASGMVVSEPGAQVEARAGTGASGRMTSAVSTRTTVRPAGGHVAGTGDYLCTATSPAQCQDPRTMRAAYGFDTLIRQGLTGQGRTIVVVDAFTSPTVAADLKEFDRQFRLPDPVFVQVAPDGVPAYDVSDADHVAWAGEISLDVEWAHAVAPGARIVLVSAR